MPLLECTDVVILFQPAPPLAKGSPTQGHVQGDRRSRVSTRSPSREGEPFRRRACVARMNMSFQPAPPLTKGSPRVGPGPIGESRANAFQPAPPREGEPRHLAPGLHEPGAVVVSTRSPSREGEPVRNHHRHRAGEAVSTRSPSREGEPLWIQVALHLDDKFQPAPPLVKGSPSASGSTPSSCRSCFNPLPLS